MFTVGLFTKFLPSFFLPFLLSSLLFFLPVSFHSFLCFSLPFSLFGLVLRLYHQHFLITDLESLDVDWKHVCIVSQLFENNLNALLGTNLWNGIWHTPKHKSPCNSKSLEFICQISNLKGCTTQNIKVICIQYHVSCQTTYSYIYILPLPLNYALKFNISKLFI